jgi:hypothetical protein
MVMTEWMKSVQEALKTIPANTPNRLKAAMAKAKLTYKKKGSSEAPANGMKKTHRRHRRSGKGRGRKGSRRQHSKRRGSSRKYKGGAMTALNPADYDGKGDTTSGVGVQMRAAMSST